jgi:hypothetical protein
LALLIGRGPRVVKRPVLKDRYAHHLARVLERLRENHARQQTAPVPHGARRKRADVPAAQTGRPRRGVGPINLSSFDYAVRHQGLNMLEASGHGEIETIKHPRDDTGVITRSPNGWNVETAGRR